MSQWAAKKEEFEPDGALRDIYIFNTNEELWDFFIGQLLQSEYRYEFYNGSLKSNLPTTFLEIKKLQDNNPTTLKIFLPKSIQINCHFFVESEIEMDVDPKEIQNEDCFKALIKFLYWLSQSLERSVRLTYENLPDQFILDIK